MLYPVFYPLDKKKRVCIITCKGWQEACQKQKNQQGREYPMKKMLAFTLVMALVLSFCSFAAAEDLTVAEENTP